MTNAYVVDIIRTPIGKYGGALSSVRPDDMAAQAIQALLARTAPFDFAQIEDVILGAANQAGEDNRNVARMALLLAGLPVSVPGVTVNRLCASGLEAIMHAAQAVQSGNGNLFISGGVESMSRAPFVMPKADKAFARQPEVYDTTMGWRFTNPRLAKLYYPFNMGETAENVAERYGVTREDQDKFAMESQERYFRAYNLGTFNDEIVPVTVGEAKNDALRVSVDEHPRKTTLEKLASLTPSFKSGGTVTAGNSSGINDGSAACLIASDEGLKLLERNPLARVVSMAVAGVEPSEMGMGPVPAVQKALARARLSIKDVGLWELNEAFASQAIACIRQLGLDSSIVNVNGGSIALGHPLGCSGVRISATLIHQMVRSSVKYGVATMCVGVGQGAAVVYEKC